MSLVEADSGQKPLRNAKGQIVPGTKLNGAGRPKGCRNKLAEVFIGDLYEKWQTYGDSVIDRVIKEQPAQFLKVVAQLMPKDVNISVRQLDELSDEQLLSRLRQVTEMARPLLDVTPVAGPQEAVDAKFEELASPIASDHKA